jgi:hypothetical protein
MAADIVQAVVTIEHCTNWAKVPKERISMSDSQFANETGSLPAAAESTDQPTSTEMKLYKVPVVANVQMSLTALR